MPSTYTLNNGIELIGTGEQSGTWGDTTNTNLELLDTALDGQVTVTATSAGSSSSPNTLPIADGTNTNSEGRNRLVIITSGTDLGADVFYQLTPSDAEKIIYIRNDLNAQDLIVFQGTYNASNDYVIPNGTTAVIFFDGAGSGAVAANVFNNAHFDALNVAGTATFNNDVTFTGANYNAVWDKSANALEFADNAKAIFGAGDDLQIYHDPSGPSSLISDQGAGDLILRGSNQIRFQDATGLEHYAIFNENGAVQIYHDNSLTLTTTSTGIDVTGTVTMDGGSTSADFTFGDNDKAIFGAGSDLQIYHDGSGSYISDQGVGSLFVDATNLRLRDASSNMYILANSGAEVELYYNGSKKLETTSTGVAVTGSDLSLTGSDATTQLTLESTNDGAGDGPVIKLYRNSASPAADDDIGRIDFNGENSVGTEIVYSRIDTFIETPTDAAEDGRMRFLVQSGGTANVNFIDLDASQGGADGRIGVNLGGSDIDFVVRGDTDNELIYADASTNRVGVSIAAPSEKLHVEDAIRIEAATPRLRFKETDGSDNQNFQIQLASGNLQFLKNNDNFSSGAVRFDMDQSGNTAISNNGTTAVSGIRLLLRQTDGQEGLRIVNEDGDAGFDPVMSLYRDSSTPADNDNLGRILFKGNTDADSTVDYGRIISIIRDATDGSTDGEMQFYVQKGGSPVNAFLVAHDEVVVNETGVEIDFRVESNNGQNAIFVDASANKVGIFKGTPADELDVGGTIRADGVLQIYDDGANQAVVAALSGNNLELRARSSQYINFVAGGTDHMRLRANGDLDIGATAISTDYGANVNIASTGTATQVSIVSTNAGATAAPTMNLYRDSATPAPSDSLGILRFQGNNDADQTINYARLQAQIIDETDGTEDGFFQIDTVIGGTITSRMAMNAATTIFNEGGIDLDFRVESTQSTASIFMSGSTGRVGLGTSSPGAALHVTDDAASTKIMVESTDAGGGDGPILEMYRNSSSPAADDDIGQISFTGELSDGTKETYALIESYIEDPSATNPEARLEFKIVQSDGTRPQFITLRSDSATPAVVVNEGSNNVDFRVETDSNTNGIMVDASANKIGFRTAPAAIFHFDVGTNITDDQGVRITCTNTGANGGPDLMLDRQSSSPADDDNIGAIHFRGKNSNSNNIIYARIRAGIDDVTNNTEDGNMELMVEQGGTLTTKASVSRHGLAIGSTIDAAHSISEYEEGSWTVNMFDAASGGNASSTQVTGRYTRIGQQVIASFDAFNNVSTSGLTAGNAVYFTLPFAASSTGRACGSCQLDNVTFTGSNTMVTPSVSDNASRAALNTSGSGNGDTTIKVSAFNGTSSDVVNWTLSYRISD